MYKIIKIKQLDVNLYELQIEHNDELEHVTINELALSSVGILKPQTITEAIYFQLKHESEIGNAYMKALNFLSFRMRSVLEMQQYLRKKEYPQTVISTVIQKLMQQDYLNDTKFTESYIKNAISTTLKGPHLISRELIELGCLENDINTFLAAHYMAEVEEQKVAKQLAKLLKKSYLSIRIFQQKTQTYLYQKGFNNIIIKEQLALVNSQDIKINDKKLQASLHKAYVQGNKKQLGEYELKQTMIQKIASKTGTYDEANSLVKRYLEEVEKSDE